MNAIASTKSSRTTANFLERRRVPSDSLRIPDPDDAEHDIEDEMRRQIDHNINKGIITLTGDGHFRYSFRGLLFLWKTIHPRHAPPLLRRKSVALVAAVSCRRPFPRRPAAPVR